MARRKKSREKTSRAVKKNSAPPIVDLTQQAGFDDLIRELKRGSNRPLAIFLGAGASKTFGYPITRDLMLKIFEGLIKGRILNKNASGPGALSDDPRAELLDFLTELLPGERYSKAKVPMVTGVLSLLDFSLATGQALLPGRTLDGTRRARQLLERALLEVIPDHEWFEEEEEERFDQFRGWLASLKSRRPPGGLAMITTNYDMASDLAAMYVADVEGKYKTWSLADLANKVDFGFRWVRPDREKEEFFPRPEHPRIALYKLHGSTNWLRCPLCENLYINPHGPIAWVAGGKRTVWDNQCHCSETRLEAQIVSPSFIREMREPNLVAIWKSTLDFLREADHWIIIGYSFPDEDVGIRALFTRAFGSKSRRPKISVVQLNDDARVNYESFFPDGSVQYLTGGLSVLLDRWEASGGRKQSRR
jgi:NAD-dependent SIR2 family protein deacetylase